MSLAHYEAANNRIGARDDLANDSPGRVRWVHDANGCHTKLVRLYNGTGSALTQYAVYMLNYDGDEETNPKVIACATSTPIRWLVVAQEATAAASWGWFACFGYTECLVEGTTDVAKDDFLKLTSGTSATAFIKDGTTITAASFAIATEAQADNSAVATRVFLLGDKATVA
jgi:hypothetical protein